MHSTTELMLAWATLQLSNHRGKLCSGVSSGPPRDPGWLRTYLKVVSELCGGDRPEALGEVVQEQARLAIDGMYETTEESDETAETQPNAAGSDSRSQRSVRS